MRMLKAKETDHETKACREIGTADWMYQFRDYERKGNVNPLHFCEIRPSKSKRELELVGVGKSMVSDFLRYLH